MAASNMPKDCKDARVALLIQYQRLLEWCKLAGILEQQQGRTFSAVIEANQVLLIAILAEISTIMNDFATLNGRYEDLKPGKDDLSEKEGDDVELLQKFSSLSIKYETEKVEKRYITGMNHFVNGAKDMKEIVKHPQRLRWVALDAANFKKLLLKVQGLIDYLHGLLDDHQMKVLHETTKSTYLEMLQVRRSVSKLEFQLDHLKMAAILLSNKPSEGAASAPRRQNEAMLAGLASFASLHHSLDEGNTRASQQETRLQTSQIEYDLADSEKFRTIATYTANGFSHYVWIEWKPYVLELVPPEFSKKTIRPSVLDRIRELTTLLKYPNKPEEFCTVTCLGYFDDRDRPGEREKGRDHPARIGFVFERPTLTPSANIQVLPGEAALPSLPPPPISLHQLLSPEWPYPKPSLTQRIALARKLSSCLLYLHVVGWLHKGLRSDNILFFLHNLNRPDLKEPYLSGFEYSRPDTPSDTTSKPLLEKKWEIYRHPDYQGESPINKARKTYDIYSLGVILLEIAYWKPIDLVMGISDLRNMDADGFKGTKNRLLDTEPQFLDGIQAEVGDRYLTIVRRCLEGAHGFGLEYDDPETSPDSGIQLQRCYTLHVVNALRDISL